MCWVLSAVVVPLQRYPLESFREGEKSMNYKKKLYSQDQNTAINELVTNNGHGKSS